MTDDELGATFARLEAADAVTPIETGSVVGHLVEDGEDADGHSYFSGVSP